MKWLINLFFLLSAGTANAYEEDGQQWLVITAQSVSASGWGGYLELQSRRSNRQEKIFEYLLRPAFFYKSENTGSFFVGTLKRFDYTAKENENRHWVQWLNTFNTDNLKLTSRFRQEYRDIKNVDAISHRSRLLLKAYADDFSVGYGWKPFLATELFYNWNDAGSLKQGLHQSRNLIGVGKGVSSSLSLEAFYMAQVLNNSGRENQLNHSIVLSLNLNL